MNVNMSRVLDLKEIYPRIKGETLPIRSTYKISKLFSAVMTESEFYFDQMAKIIDQYAEKNEDGVPIRLESNNGIKIKEGLSEEAQQKVNELLSIGVELPDVKFSLEELESIKLSIEDFNVMLPFIED